MSLMGKYSTLRSIFMQKQLNLHIFYGLLIARVKENLMAKMEHVRVHILSDEKEICSLIVKTLDESFIITCTHGEKMIKDPFGSAGEKLDCIIIDKGLSECFKTQVLEKYGPVHVICLPSFEGEYECDEFKNVKYMSEPFKLSELRELLEEVRVSLAHS